jgi:hypothetical protein
VDRRKEWKRENGDGRAVSGDTDRTRGDSHIGGGGVVSDRDDAGRSRGGCDSGHKVHGQ